MPNLNYIAEKTEYAIFALIDATRADKNMSEDAKYKLCYAFDNLLRIYMTMHDCLNDHQHIDINETFLRGDYKEIESLLKSISKNDLVLLKI